MNYEQKYKQALERARIGLHDCNLLDCDDMTRKVAITTIYHLFPELTEDEDERIRKGIIRNLQYLMDRSEGFVKEDLQERITWLQKQCVQKNTRKREIDDAYLQGICDAKHAIEKQGEQPIDKVELKFKVGEWITNGDYTWKIVEVKPLDYMLQSQDGNIVDDTISYVDEHFYLWSINDAKDGDVLVNGSNIFIFHFINGTRLMGYCHVNMDDELLYDDIGRNECFCLIDAIVTPATKEQRVLLFSKIKEAGYEWDAYKKELKKIEATSKKNEDEKIRKAILGLVKQSSEILGKQNQNNMIAWLEKSNPVWSEEDEQMILSIEQIMNCASLLNIVPEKIDNIKSWLKSLRPQKQWKPSTAHKREIEKQGEQLDPDKVIAWLVANICDYDYYVKLFKKDFDL